MLKNRDIKSNSYLNMQYFIAKNSLNDLVRNRVKSKQLSQSQL